MSLYDSVRHTIHNPDVLRFEGTVCGITTQNFDLEESLLLKEFFSKNILYNHST